MEISRVGEFTLGWGESLVWDEQRQRLYFVDCAAQTLHWLDEGNDELHTLTPGSMPAGLVPTHDGRLIAVLHDGLFVIDPDAGTADLLASYPDALDGRCNDACADLDGNLITGKLNIGPAEGSAWWYSSTLGWRMLDDAISNTNGPNVGVLDGQMTLIIGDTSADYFSYPYDPAHGSVGVRSVFGDLSQIDGGPDGATLDADGGLWCALFGGGGLVRFTTDGFDRAMPMAVANPTDVAFGGSDLDRLYVVSIAGAGGEELDGALLVIDGLEVVGRPEPRFALAPVG
jgi:sugar lactone lactonase YvrE